MSERSVLLVLHDVSPESWVDYRDFVSEVDALGDIPMSWLVVPDFHKRNPLQQAPEFCRLLERRLAQGDELILHGHHHCDDQPPPRTPRDYFMRRVYTWEGEFYGLTEDQATARLDAGIELFRRLGWPLHGFVAPAWLMSQGTRDALRHSTVAYTSDARYFYELPGSTGASHRVEAPGIVWSAGSAWRRGVSKVLADIRERQLQQATTLRLGIHPVDMRHGFARRYWLTLLQRLLEDGRQPMTKIGWLQAQGLCLPGSSSGSCKLPQSSAAPSNSVPFSGVKASGS